MYKHDYEYNYDTMSEKNRGQIDALQACNEKATGDVIVLLKLSMCVSRFFNSIITELSERLMSRYLIMNNCVHIK